MKLVIKLLSFVLLSIIFTGNMTAQQPESVLTESSDPNDVDKPLDDVVKRTIITEKRVLPYEDVREADLFWEKRIWRVIDVREKMNLPFAYPERPFFTILTEAAIAGEIKVYSTEDDKFSSQLTPDEVSSQLSRLDTVIDMDEDTYEEITEVVRNDIDPSDVKRFRIKEMWYFDKESSVMKVRILGISPMIDVLDDNGNFKYERPMFWVYYPDVREVLARERVFNVGNDASPVTWDDLLEMRYFSSYIYKESNVQDQRLEDYLSGVDLLLEGEKIKSEIFNFEHDLWSY